MEDIVWLRERGCVGVGSEGGVWGCVGGYRINKEGWAGWGGKG